MKSNPSELKRIPSRLKFQLTRIFHFYGKVTNVHIVFKCSLETYFDDFRKLLEIFL